MPRPTKLSRERENLLILRVKTSREPLEDICAEFGVSVETYRNIVKRRGNQNEKRNEN